MIYIARSSGSRFVRPSLSWPRSRWAERATRQAVVVRMTKARNHKTPQVEMKMTLAIPNLQSILLAVFRGTECNVGAR